MEVLIGGDVDSGLVHTVTTMLANAHDVTPAHDLIHVQKWEIFLMLGKRNALDKLKASDALTDRIKKLKACVRAKVKHLFRVIKYYLSSLEALLGPTKNTRQMLVMFAQFNLWMVRKRMIQVLAA